MIKQKIKWPIFEYMRNY